MNVHQDQRIWRFKELTATNFAGTALEPITTDLYQLIDSFALPEAGPIKSKYAFKPTPIMSADQPWNVALGRNGEYLVTEHGLHRVQIFDSQGKSIQTVGKQGNGPGQLTQPIGIAVWLKTGEYVVAEFGNNRAQLFDERGNSLKLIGSGAGVLNGQMSAPYDCAFTPEGHIAVVEMNNHRIQVLTRDGDFLMKIDNSSAGPNLFSVATGLKVDSRNGNFVLFQNKTVVVFSPEGQILKNMTGDWSAFSGGIDGAGNYIIANRSGSSIVILNSEGEKVMEFGSKRERQDLHKMITPYSLVVDYQGNIVVCDTGKNRVVVWG